MRRLPFVLIVVASLGSLCGPRPGPPPADSCSQPSTGAVDLLELGTGTEDTFVAVQDDDVIQPIHGPQGGTMIPIRLRSSGAGTPACLSQKTVIQRGTDVIAQDGTALKTYLQPDGSFLTRPNYLVFAGFVQPGESITIVATAGLKTTSRRVFVQVAGDLGLRD